LIWSTILIQALYFTNFAFFQFEMFVKNTENMVEGLNQTYMTDNFNQTCLNCTLGFTNGTEHQGFLHGFVEALSVILVSELGDKTFFIAAILAMTNNKITVFLSAISALATMTVLSALLGFVVTTFVPTIYTYYTCTAIMFIFGLKMLWDGFRMKSNEAEEIQNEVAMEITNRDRSLSQPNVEISDPEEAENLAQKVVQQKCQKEKSLFGKTCLKQFKLFVNGFVMTFLAEWGDRSQLATIVLAGINDVDGIIVGGVLGHTICTGLAVIAGALISRKISVRAVTFIGAIVFLGLAVASLIWFEPEHQNETINEVLEDAK